MNRRPRLVRTTALLVALALATVPAASTVRGQGSSDPPAGSAALVAGASPQVLRGAATYDLHCSACHGDGGGGIAEARRAFPESERRCSRCHRRANPPQMDLARMEWNYAFDIGAPPALTAAGLARYGSAAGLHAYLSAAMPRPYPGTLSEAEMWDVVAFLLELTGAAPVPDDLGAASEVPLAGP